VLKALASEGFLMEEDAEQAALQVLQGLCRLSEVWAPRPI
jgi:hypothetical protein